jgi:DNA invertase Pin-like site-specific DNA recombinase
MNHHAVIRVGTSRADTAYHACHARPRDVVRSQAVRAFCGGEVRVLPHVWDEARQARQDSCHRCARRVADVFAARERDRVARGPTTRAYIRASTDRQIQSPEVQEAIIRGHCARHGLGEPLIYSDPSATGKSPLKDRPAGRRLLADLVKGDHVVIARLDRLSRNFLEFAATVDAWGRRGITLHPCDFGMIIKPDDPLCQAFVQFLGIFAQYERQMIASRTREALAHRRTLGMRTSYDAPMGFRWVKQTDGKYHKHVCDHEGPVCLKALELALSGYSHMQIAGYLTDEWGVANRRQEAGRAWNREIMYKLVDRGLQILDERGLPLPAGVRSREDLRPS